MGNLCCGEDDIAQNKQRQTVSGGAPPAKVMTPTEDERRSQALAAAEERARQHSVRGTQRYTPKAKPKYDSGNEYQFSNNKGPDISDWT